MCRAHNNVLKCSEEQVLRQVMGFFLPLESFARYCRYLNIIVEDFYFFN